MDPPSKHIGYFVRVGPDGKKAVLSDWIHDMLVHNGGRELWRNSKSVADQTVRLRTLVGPLAGTPLPYNVICISEKPHRTIKWLMALAAGVPVVKWKVGGAPTAVALCAV